MVVLPLLAALSWGCEDNRTSKVEELMSANPVRTEDPVEKAPPPPSFKEIPPINIDTIGVKIGGRGASDLAKEKNQKKLKEVIDAIPHEGKPVKIRALQKAKIVDVVETVWLLGQAGVTEVVIQTKPKSNGKACNVDNPPADKCLPGELMVTPESTLAKAPAACSITGTITADNNVGIWGFGQTGGRKHRPGFGGADLSSAQETIEKNLRSCKSDKAFFSADYKMHWELAYNVGATIRFMDKDGQIKKLVLLGDKTVAGRPVKLRK
jgi:biopolymer transport protein ExbD